MKVALNGWIQEMNNQSPLITEIANLPLFVQLDPVDSLNLLHNPTKGGLSGSPDILVPMVS